ncbi:DUF2783 domain-containing protein [Roseomonas sp. OT10]|uniref:DUF2783 domain-containing protein n=1 Tax=Roseomonas cutis TaxID=2897332 RepID=UPI001E4BC555|nr:DUF2783 domain-containing protein [Roseomonas sp. OT10]UFN47237.1 DUF2783 domain-containing protein [Roseomonas sp. OT10]
MPNTQALNTGPNIAAPDEFYEALLAIHQDLTPEQSRLVNARLILLLCNQIGEMGVLRAALAKAREGIMPAGADRTIAVTA